MKRKARRYLGVSALCFVLGLWLTGCSGQQQSEDGVEVSENSEGKNAENGNAATAGNATAENGDASGDAGSPAGEEGAATTAAAGGSENDLQEIITEMNGQQPAGEAPPAPLPQEATPPPPPQAAPAAAPTPQVANSAGPAIPFQPGGTPAGKGLPEVGSKMAYVVEKGDTLAAISQKIYGSNKRWKELASLSGINNPSRIFPGDLVYYTLDEGAIKFAEAYEATPRSEEQVKPGDTLATIAKRIYGKTTAWRSIWRQNDKINNPDVVPPGTTVYYLPKGAAVAALKKLNHNKVVYQAEVKVQKTNNNFQLNPKIINSTKEMKTITNNSSNINNTLSNITTNIGKIDQDDRMSTIATYASRQTETSKDISLTELSENLI